MPRRPFAVIDAETDPFSNGARIDAFVWGYYDGTEYIEFSDRNALVDFCMARRQIVYAHNGGKFDYLFFVDRLEPYSEIMMINGRLAKFTIGQCEFRDSFNILPVGLKQFEKDDIDYRLMQKHLRDIPENKAKISAYLKSDCVHLYDLVKAYFDDFGCDLTQASGAMRQWKKITHQKPPRTDRAFYEALSPWYFGGRVECFQTGVIEKPFTVLDINSAYPYAMLSPHPFSVEFDECAGRPELLRPQDFYEVEAVSLGALPYVDPERKTEKLQFPNDTKTRRYKITGWELLAGLETASVFVSKWIKYLRFREDQDFTAYIMQFWQRRQIAKAEGDKARDLLNKLAMNGLYGKWGANPSKYRRHLIVPESEFDLFEVIKYDENEYVCVNNLGPWLLAERRLNEEESRYYNVATSASITGFVRAFLWRAIHSCGAGNVLYCDTDSLVTSNIGDAVILSNELGAWKNEGNFIRAAIAGKKTYAFERAHHAPHDSKQMKFDRLGRFKYASKGAFISPAAIFKIAAGAEYLYKPAAPTFSLKGGMRYIDRRIRATF